MSDLAQAILLGVIQGVTEFIPISSDGHLAAAQLLLGLDTKRWFALNVAMHFSTLLAMFIVFRKGYVRLWHGVLRRGAERRELGLVLLGAIPAGIAGLLCEDWIESLPDRFAYTVPLCWALSGAALLSLRRLIEQPGAKEIDARIALWIGCWQILALLPGLSRSGITIASALWAGCRRDRSAEYSFLMGTPLILGAALFESRKLFGADGSNLPLAVALPAFIAAFVSGWLALVLLLRFLTAGRLHLWGYYLLVVAALFAGWLAMRA